LEPIQVNSVHRLNSNTDESFGKFSNLFVVTDNLPVEIRTSRSAFASKNDKQRLIGSTAQSLSFLQVENPFNVAVDGGRCRFLLSENAC
jgi:hypothetical protein